jgi:hypothetical protein
MARATPQGVRAPVDGSEEKDIDRTTGEGRSTSARLNQEAEPPLRFSGSGQPRQLESPTAPFRRKILPSGTAMGGDDNALNFNG